MKLKISIMEKIIKYATAKEIDFLLYTMRFQDELGVVRGITRAEVCSFLHIHKSKYYHIIESLEKKGIIHVHWDEKRYKFWTFTVIDNSFVGKDSYKDYINLNTSFLSTEAFLELTKGEKVICLKVLSVYREERKSIKLTLKTLMSWTGMSLQSVKRYISSIKNIFAELKLSGATIIINTAACFAAFARGDKTEKEIFNEHELDYILAVNKVRPEQAEKQETLSLFKQFEKKHKHNTIVSAIIDCLTKHKELKPKYINKMIHVISKDESQLIYFH